jgi:hypothetical protein
MKLGEGAMDTTGYFILLFVHLASLVLALGSVLVIDVFGLLWIFRKKALSEVFKVAAVTQTLIWIGWGLLVTTGVPLLLMKGVVDDLVKLKLFLVALAGLNGLFLDRVKKDGEKVPDFTVPPVRLIFRIALSSAISQLSWWGAMLIGFYQGNVEHLVRWPKKPALWMAGIAAVGAAVYALGLLLTREKPQEKASAGEDKAT